MQIWGLADGRYGTKPLLMVRWVILGHLKQLAAKDRLKLRFVSLEKGKAT